MFEKIQKVRRPLSKVVASLLIVCLVISACSTPKKSPPKRTTATISRADMLKGGTSYSKPVVILQRSEREVLDEEYKWLAVNYPGYGLIRRDHKLRSSRHYDVVRIKTREGRLRDIYFDSTSFWGKN